MCSGRVDMAFVLRAFLNGNDGVFIGGCWPGDCHYITEGNYLAISTMHLCGKILDLIGVNPARLRLEWVSASEGIRFAEVMHDFAKELEELGPLGKGEGMNQNELKSKLEAVINLIPYIKLVEREKLRIPHRSEDQYNDFLTSDEFNKLFDDLIGDKLTISRIMSLLRKKPCSAGEISRILGIDKSETSRHINNASRKGFIIYDESRERFAPAT